MIKFLIAFVAGCGAHEFGAHEFVINDLIVGSDSFVRLCGGVDDTVLSGVSSSGSSLVIVNECEGTIALSLNDERSRIGDRFCPRLWSRRILVTENAALIVINDGECWDSDD